MDQVSLERARRRIENGRDGQPDQASLEAALESARTSLERFAEQAAELEASVPERVGTAIQEGMRAEVLPVARHVAEVRGLSTQTIRRLERLQGDIAAERMARVDDLALLVELVSSGWRAVERRLDRLERMLDRLERSVDNGHPASLYEIEENQEFQPRDSTVRPSFDPETGPTQPEA